MKITMVQHREGEDIGPVDWDHPMAQNMPKIWHEAEKYPHDFLFQGRWEILSICMYDGWPYWTPNPAILFIGPMKYAEWNFFNGYGVHADSITRKTAL